MRNLHKERGVGGNQGPIEGQVVQTTHAIHAEGQDGMQGGAIEGKNDNILTPTQRLIALHSLAKMFADDEELMLKVNQLLLDEQALLTFMKTVGAAIKQEGINVRDVVSDPNVALRLEQLYKDALDRTVGTAMQSKSFRDIESPNEEGDDQSGGRIQKALSLTDQHDVGDDKLTERGVVDSTPEDVRRWVREVLPTLSDAEVDGFVELYILKTKRGMSHKEALAKIKGILRLMQLGSE